MADQAASVEEREGEVAGSADQQGQPGLLRPQPVVLGVRQVSLGPLDHPAIRTSKRTLLTESNMHCRAFIICVNISKIYSFYGFSMSFVSV